MTRDEDSLGYKKAYSSWLGKVCISSARIGVPRAKTKSIIKST